MKKQGHLIICDYLDGDTLEFIEKFKNKEIFLVLTNETSIDVGYDIDFICKKLQSFKKINFLVNSKDLFFHDRINPDYFIKHNVFEWPLSFLYLTHSKYTHFDNNVLFRNINLSFKNLYLNKTNRARYHRVKLLNALNQSGLIEMGINTFLNPELVDIEGVHELPTDFLHYISFLDKNKIEGYNWASEKYLEHNALFEIVTETNYHHVRYSEKTLMAILNQRPFLILGARGIHKKLEEMGFKLFDNIFDYSFDSYDTLEKRIDGIISNLNRYKDKNKNIIFDSAKNTLHHNQQFFAKKLFYDETIDKQFISEINKFDIIDVDSIHNPVLDNSIVPTLINKCEDVNFNIGKWMVYS